MRKAGQIVATVLQDLAQMVRPGITTASLDAYCDKAIRKLGATPSFKGYRGYPASLCTSVNEEIVHGIPSSRVLVEGDIVKLDVGSIYRLYQGDSTVTVPVGRVSDVAQRLIETTRAALYAGIAECRVGKQLGDIGSAIQARAEAAGFSVVREYTGHGIGRAMHEEPSVPNWGFRGSGLGLRAGMTFALEPMVNVGGYRTRSMPDGWTVTTEDRSLSAHFEHTVAVTDGEPEVLTAW